MSAMRSSGSDEALVGYLFDRAPPLIGETGRPWKKLLDVGGVLDRSFGGESLETVTVLEPENVMRSACIVHVHETCEMSGAKVMQVVGEAGPASVICRAHADQTHAQSDSLHPCSIFLGSTNGKRKLKTSWLAPE